jgi:hypothetical protein
MTGLDRVKRLQGTRQGVVDAKAHGINAGSGAEMAWKACFFQRSRCGEVAFVAGS